jgi:hypothetical protein
MKKKLGNALKIGIPFVATMALVLSAALPVMADNKSKPVSTLRTVQGEVISITSDNATSGDATIVIQNGNQQQVTVKVDSNTKYFIAPSGQVTAVVGNGTARYKVAEKTANNGQSKKLQVTEQLEAGTIANCGNGSGEEAQFSDIQVGDRIIAWVKTADNVATKVLIIKAPGIQTVRGTIRGTITAISDNSTTITPSSGNSVTLSWDGNTRFVLKGFISVQVGQYASAVYNKNTMTAQTVDVQATAPASEGSCD